jgi:hypothetical protein
MDLQELEWGRGRDLFGSVYGRMADFCEGCGEHSDPLKFGEFLDNLKTISFLRKTLLAMEFYI